MLKLTEQQKQHALARAVRRISNTIGITSVELPVIQKDNDDCYYCYVRQVGAPALTEGKKVLLYREPFGGNRWGVQGLSDYKVTVGFNDKNQTMSIVYWDAKPNEVSRCKDEFISYCDIKLL